MPKENLLLTGRGGFLGHYLYDTLNVHFDVNGLGLSSENDYVQDLSSDTFTLSRPFSYVIHAAGKAHVQSNSKEEQQEFFDVNVKGTQTLLDSLDDQPASISLFIFISSVAVYGDSHKGQIDENSALLGETAYAKSKIKAEELVRSWCEERDVNFIILRLPLIIGANAPGNLGALVTSISSGKYVQINDLATRRSMVLASDVSRFILELINKNASGQIRAVYNLTDGCHPYLSELENSISEKYQKPIRFRVPLVIVKSIRSMLIPLVKLSAMIGIHAPLEDVFEKLNKLLSTLTFSDAKARRDLGWSPSPVLSFYRQVITPKVIESVPKSHPSPTDTATEKPPKAIGF